jgi:Fe2+ or Zn2+ uptake regulation protein
MSRIATQTAAADSQQLSIFYNTTHMTEEELRIRRLGVNKQNRAILKFFQDNPNGYFTPFEVQLYAGLDKTPITSIRRAVNTLTDAGLLIKTDKLRPGDYGVMNHTWKLA